MHRTIIQVAIVATALAVVGPALAAEGPTVHSSPLRASTQLTALGSLDEVAATSRAEPAAMLTGLCGLTPSDVVDIVDYYDLDPHMPTVANALSTPFQCAEYGDLCSALPVADARNYACGVWQGLKAHQPVESLASVAINKLETWGTECTPNQDVCEEICDEWSVLECSGVYHSGKCNEIALCDIFDMRAYTIPFFEVLGPT